MRAWVSQELWLWGFWEESLERQAVLQNSWSVSHLKFGKHLSEYQSLKYFGIDKILSAGSFLHPGVVGQLVVSVKAKT